MAGALPHAITLYSTTTTTTTLQLLDYYSIVLLDLLMVSRALNERYAMLCYGYAIDIIHSP